MPALKCDWFFNFARQGDHFTILTGLAHSRLETLRKWIEANVSDVLLTCWANNSHHQQFYLALLVPTVKLTMHSISIRQENDPCCPCVFSAENLQWCTKKQTIKLEGIFAFMMNTMYHSLFEREGAAVNAQCFSVLSNPGMEIRIHNHPLHYLPRVASSFLILASVACSHMNHVSCTYVLMMSPLQIFYTVTLPVPVHACLRLCQKHVIWAAPHRKKGFS